MATTTSTTLPIDGPSADRARLLAVLAEKSFQLGDFRLSSGGRSDYYLDCRRTTLDGEGGWLTGRLILASLRDSGELRPGGAAIEAVGGLTLGADPIVTAVAVVSAAERAGRPLSAFIVRKSEKAHGTGQKIEGLVRAGMNVAILDDVCTTAASTIQALEAAWAADLVVRRVMCLVEREEAGGRANLDAVWKQRFAAENRCPFTALFTAAEVRAEYLRRGEAGARGGR
ncbi:MAG: orotate phosphoribosyltransferase [Terriglobales bacterium]